MKKRSHPKLDKRLTEFAVVTLISCMTLLPIIASAQGAAISLVAQSTTQTSVKSFSDVNEHHPYAATIAQVRARGVVNGNPDGTFAPEKTINRAELATMVVASLTKTPKGSHCFTDVHEEWFAPYVCEAKKRGFVSGYPDGSYKPFNNVNFSEAALIIAKAQGLNPAGATNGQPWYQPALFKLDQIKAIPTTVDRFDTKISRAQTAEVIYRVLNPNLNKASKPYTSLTTALPTLNSCDELSDKLEVLRYKNYRQSRNARMYMMEKSTGAVSEDSAESAPMPQTLPPNAEAATANEAGARDEAATDFSTTNTQVSGVDEADVIKNDGEFIYMVSGKTVRIIKAYQPQNLAEVARLELSDKDFTPSEIYVYGTKLVVLGSTMHRPVTPDPMPVDGAPSAKMMPSIYPYYPTRSKLFVIDMANKGALKEERSIEFDGYTVSTRRIDDYVYLVTNKSPDYHVMFYRADGADVDWNRFENAQDAQSILPTYKDSRLGKDMPLVNCASVRFMPDYNDINFMSVAAVNITNPAAPIRKEVVMGAGDTIYSSRENLYVASTQYVYPTAEIYDTFAPVNYQEKTRVTQFKLTKGDITVGTSGTVPGHILNQFSMDENADSFRIATTVGEVWGPRGASGQSKNNLYVLSKNDLSQQTGALENLAPGETIYSVRFAGNRAYLVTFKKIDPFFVIDLSDKNNPRVLGELKIPGYSDYLHPLDDNHVLGFGKDAVDPTPAEKGRISWWNNSNFAWYQGLKVAVFDVTDTANPKLQGNLVIGDRGSDSELLYNHKALFFDKARGLIAFPATIHEVKNKSADNPSAYGTPIFQGAEVLKLDANNQLSELGRISHLPTDAFAGKDYLPYEESQLFINRILSIGNYLYTVGQGRIRASDINTLSEVKSLDVQYDKEQPWWGVYAE